MNRTVKEVAEVIKWTGKERRRVRVSGMRHSWTEVFSENDEVLVCLLPIEVTDHLTYARFGKDGEKNYL